MILLLCLFALHSAFVTTFFPGDGIFSFALPFRGTSRGLNSDNRPRARPYSKKFLVANQHRLRQSLKGHSSFAVRVNSLLVSRFTGRSLFLAAAATADQLLFCPSVTRFSWKLRHPFLEDPPGSICPSKEDLSRSFQLRSGQRGGVMAGVCAPSNKKTGGLPVISGEEELQLRTHTAREY